MNKQPNLELEMKITDVLNIIKESEESYWHEVKRLNLPPLAFNPYAYVDYGKIMSNGLHEKSCASYTIYWDGSILKRPKL